MEIAIIFGGTGFIGSHFARFLLENNYSKIYLVDIEAPGNKVSQFRRTQLNEDSRIVYIYGDVRNLIDFELRVENALIVNFAAIHREPGHQVFEYFETNILGAENVCKFAEKINCKNIIFSSSISPYGISENARDESSLPQPETPYGSSKLAAEKIHQIWQAKDSLGRCLTIIRPGVVFGPGEGGNVTRLVKAVLKRYFFYMGNRGTRKSGVYVKELCNAVWWVHQHQLNGGNSLEVFNMTMTPPPSIEEYVDSICKVTNVNRYILEVPFVLLISASKVIDIIAKFFRVKNSFSPVRVYKLIRSNNILATRLISMGYEYQYSLYSAMRDWKKECPEDWSI